MFSNGVCLYVGRIPCFSAFAFSIYINNTIEVPWMVINGGVRVDYVNYNTRLWADPSGYISPYRPYFYLDADRDNEWDENDFYDANGNGIRDVDASGNYFADEYLKEPLLDESEAFISQARVLFTI